MSIIGSNALAGASGQAGAGPAPSGFQIDRSVRLNSADTAYFSRTPSTAGNRRTWTWSGWIKRSAIANHTIFAAGGTVNYEQYALNINEAWGSSLYDGAGSDGYSASPDGFLRDVSAWYHIVVAFDTTQATASDRIKLYLNGELQVNTSSTYPAQNYEGEVNNTTAHTIGRHPNTSQYYTDAYLAEIHFVDGQQLAASDFGQYDSNNVWQPKAYSGTYGTNGFHLDFSDNSSNAALGTDSSGASNNWTVNNIVAEQPTTLPGVAFDGSGDFLKISGSSDFDFGTGDFTVECFVYFNNLSNNQGVLDTRSSSNTNGFALLGRSNGTVSMADGTSLIGDAISVSHSQWVHLAASRSGSSLKFFVDGVLSSTVTNSTDFSNDDFIIGTVGGGTEDLNGFVSNVRVIKGTALYTSSFTLPTTPLSNVTNTVLLCCQSSSSASAATVSPGTITVNGDAFATEFSDSTAANDSLIDTPTNYTASSGNNGGNYCTFNPLDNGGASVTNGNLDWDSGSNQGTRSTFFVSSGKWYWELTYNESNLIGEHGVSTRETQALTGGTAWPGSVATSWGFSNSSGNKANNNSSTNIATAGAQGDVVMIALDMDNGKIWWGRNGTWFSSGDPSAGTNAAFTNLSGYSVSPMAGVGGAAAGAVSYNFGSRSFSYTPPTGFLSICTTNLSDPTIADGSTAFDVALYTGDGNSTQTITGLNFAPDLTWQKIRNQAGDHGLTDSVRGVSAGYLQSEDTDAEKGNADNGVSAFNSDGFTVKGSFNTSSNNWVTWTWDAGSSTVSNTDGSITSQVRANPTAGFSIVSYTGNGTAGATVGHGLGANVAVYFAKNRTTANSWAVIGHALNDAFGGSQKYLNLDTTGAAGIASQGPGNSSTIELYSDASNNSNGDDFVAYCFTPVEGYSAFGSYTGNGSTDGPFIFTGFRPAFILLKRTDSASNWILSDTARDPYNEAENLLRPNLSDAEVSQYLDQDILSNGFKHRGTDGASNASGGTYIYAAFAEHPFKTARAR